jgi:small subunit ribosomal protein S12
VPTYNQTVRNKRIPKKKINRTPALERCPQKKGYCIKLVIRAPKKPNSALRKLAKLKLFSNHKRIYAYIPGEKHNLQNYSTVLIRGGRVKDLPGVKYHIIRGKLDLRGVRERKTSRSKYGTKDLRRYL